MTPLVLETSQWLPGSRESVFEFFADATNLNSITPTWLGFRILTPLPVQMRAGARIDYRIRIRGWPVTWKTEITAWEPPLRFVDEQIRGPYRLWRHEHTFTPENDGTRMVDRVEYLVPLGSSFAGNLIHRWWVRPELERIFGFRRERLSNLFGSDTHKRNPSTP